MCRLAAYLGPRIPLRQFLLEPPHSLVCQAWAPRELYYAKLNADGYGFGWYGTDAAPGIYTNPMPIWSDRNLEHLACSLESEIWLANVRSATQGSPVHQANTQPFYNGCLMFVHNGFLQDFRGDLRLLLEAELEPAFRTAISGDTDSEYLFALLRQHMDDDQDFPIEDAIHRLFRQLEGLLGDREALLNIVISDGCRLYATRHALNHECPSLYYITDDEAFPDAQVVASESLTEADLWQPVPEHHMLILDPDQPPNLIAL